MWETIMYVALVVSAPMLGFLEQIINRLKT